MKSVLFVLAMLLPGVALAQGDLRKIQYDGFTLWMDCERRGPAMFQYIAGADTGNEKKPTRFYLDRDHLDCQQTATKTYSRGRDAGAFPVLTAYDRGHLVPANHFDGTPEHIAATNVMTNIVPQAAVMNRGAWLQTEMLIECYRDQSPVYVLGGVIWGENTEDDYFLESHNIQTPDAYWKVIYTEPMGVLAWVVPNSTLATRSRARDYVVGLDEIQQQTGVTVQLPESAVVTNEMWDMPKDCDRS